MEKIYIDTNIIIEGLKSQDNHKLRELALSKRIDLYISPEILTEQKRRSLNPYIIKLQNKKDTNESNISYDQQRKLENDEKSEMEFWKGLDIKFTSSTFAGLMSLCFQPDLRNQVDYKNELDLLKELIYVYKLKKFDPLHLMHAHSAEMDYLLSNDKKFVKKASKVKWLKTKVIFPSDLMNLDF